MAEDSVRFALDDGEMLNADLRRIYDSLWEISDEPGAVSTAAIVVDVSRLRAYAVPRRVERPAERRAPQGRSAASRY
jgi:hypothetical protein